MVVGDVEVYNTNAFKKLQKNYRYRLNNEFKILVFSEG